MTEAIREKLDKVYKLVSQGATEGERTAARKALDRLMEKYNIERVLNENQIRDRTFKYTTRLEWILLGQILRFMVDKTIIERCTRYPSSKAILAPLGTIDFVTVDSAYEYFRRHMRKEWTKVSSLILKKCRTTKGKNKKREALQDQFIQAYIIKSKLIDREEVITREVSGEALRRAQIMAGVNGGQYNRQVVMGLMLTE